MRPWRLLDYVTPTGRIPYQEWYESLDAEAQAAVDDTVLTLMAYDDWTDRENREFKQLKRAEAGLSEIRSWVFGEFHPKKGRPTRRRIRTFGLYRVAESKFVFLGGCEKKHGGYEYIPDNAKAQAMKHKQDFETGKGTTRDHV
jgi:hypothetical protein